MGLPINFIVGGCYQDGSLPYYECSSDLLLAEIDESDGTINQFNPEITVLLNLDWDHADYYKDFNSLKKVFEDLLQKTRSKILIEASNFETFESRDVFRSKCQFIDLKSMSIDLPSIDQKTMSNLPEKRVKIEISKEGEVLINNQIIDDFSLVALNAQFRTISSDVKTAIISADSEAKYQYLVTIIESLNRNGFKNIQINGVSKAE